jgi:hypothetical protein
MSRDYIFKFDELQVWRSASDQLVFRTLDEDNGTATSTYFSREKAKELRDVLNAYLDEAPK